MDIDKVAFNKLQITQDNLQEEPLEVAKSPDPHHHQRGEPPE